MSIWRNDFPGLNHAYLDSAATAHKPRVVIDRVAELMGDAYATVSRGLYKSSQDMTTAYENARARIGRFVGTDNANEIVFTKNATEALNLIAQSWGRANLQAGDRIVLTTMEHHANIVPWQLIQSESGFSIDVLPITDAGDLDLSKLDQIITPQTKLFSFTAASNVLGTINPVADIIKAAKAINPQIITIVDASQAAPHGLMDVRAWGCDFAVCTGHKIYAPTGVGLLYGREDLLNEMPPFLGGGDMIDVVDFAGTTYRTAPHRFEAGTPAFVEVIALATALDYLDACEWNAISAHEDKMAVLLFDTLSQAEGVRVIGAPPKRLGIAPFILDGCHPQDVAMILDQMGVSVRVGHHCAMPLLKTLGHNALIRASIGLYTNEADIMMLGAALNKAKRMLS